jgi:tetratricopeptide (TPR) repeat protein
VRARQPGFNATLANEDRRAAWHRNLAEAHYGLGNAGDNIAECKRTLALLGWPVPAKRVGTIASLLRYGASVAACSVLPSRVYKVEAPAERKRTQIAAMAAHRMANAAFTEQDAILTVLGSVMSMRLAIRTDPFVNSARCKGGLGIVLGMSGLKKQAVALFERSIAEAESIEDFEGLTYAHYARALFHAANGGHWAEVDADVERALELADRLGDVQERQITLVIAATSRYLRGDFEESCVLYDRLLETAIPRRHHQHVAWAYDTQSRARARQGRFEEAIETSQRFHALLPKLQDDDIADFNVALGAVFFPVFVGEWAEAVANLARAEKAIVSLRSPFWALTITLDLFGDALELMGREGTERVERRALDHAERVFLKGLAWYARRVPNAGAVALLHSGRAALRQGRHSKAARLAKASLNRAYLLANPFDAARARLLLAEIDDKATEAAREHARAAAEVFERCGAVPYLRRCE